MAVVSKPYVQKEEGLEGEGEHVGGAHVQGMGTLSGVHPRRGETREETQRHQDNDQRRPRVRLRLRLPLRATSSQLGGTHLRSFSTSTIAA